MSYEEKGVWVYLAVTVVMAAVYVGMLLTRAADFPITDGSYVSTLIWVIGISIGLSIVTRIAVEIVRPSDSTRADVRDKAIGRLGGWISGLVVSIGMVVPLGLALAEIDHFWIANTMYAVYVLSALISSPVQIVAYRRGL